MKKMLFVGALMASLLFLTVGRPSSASAEVMPAEFVNGGVLILGEYAVGTAWFIDRSSIRIEQEGPPEYILSFQTFPARYDKETGEITRVFEGQWAQCKFNVDEDKMFLFHDVLNSWIYIDPIGIAGETPLDTCGEMAWYIIYKKPFYGGRKWRDGNGQLRWSNYGEELYRRIDRSY